MSAKDCIFCKIGRGEIAGDVLYRDDKVFVVRDINPRAPVHLLLIPQMHMEGLAYIGPAQAAMVGHLFIVGEEMARREGVTLSGYRLIVNQGPDSGQEVPHIHMHLLGGKPLSAMG